MDPKWTEIPQFVPLSRTFQSARNTRNTLDLESEKMGNRQRRRESTDSKRKLRINDKLKLQKLIQCLAVSELERNQLKSDLDSITLQKQQLDSQLDLLRKELDVQQQSTVKMKEVEKLLREKESSIEVLREQLRLQDPHLQSKLLEIQSEIQKLSLTIPSITLGLSKVEEEVKHIPEKIPRVQVPAVMNSIPNQGFQHSVGGFAQPGLSFQPMQTYSIPTHSVPTYPTPTQSLPAQSSPLQKQSTTIPTQSSPVQKTQVHTLSPKHVNSTQHVETQTSTTQQHIYINTPMAQTEMPKPPIPHPIPREPHYETTTSEYTSLTEDVPLELLLKKILERRSLPAVKILQSDLDQLRNSKRESTKERERKSMMDASTSPPQPHNAKRLEKRYKEKVSWVCPGCITDSSYSMEKPQTSFLDCKTHKSFLGTKLPSMILDERHVKPNVSQSKRKKVLKRKDNSVLYGNDTSMLHPLEQIVKELEELDDEDVEVLSSLNGLQ